ncbi:MAG: T9SS type A sorting domain-containing protein, partial [Flavobacteriales bacterium]|nr:T9SS type A sorting domain-containing protein [Flavobacteriales bacterium]
YPGFSPHGGTPQDKVNFTLLLNEIRVAIDTYGATINKTMLLTIAVGASIDRMNEVEWTNVAQIVDIINLMSYDFFGAWNPITNHNSPLYAPALGDPEFNLHSSVQRLINDHNVAPQQITVGVAFYGRSATTTGTPGLHVPNTSQADLITFGVDAGTPLYYNVLANMHLFTRSWDSIAEVPFLAGNGSLKTFLSYDDDESIAKKAEYIVDYNLRGAIIWEITGDYIETYPGSGVIDKTPLVDTLNYTFCNYTASPINPIVTISGSLQLCNGETTVLFANGANSYVWNDGSTDDSLVVSPGTTTIYTVTGSNATGSSTEQFTVEVLSATTSTITEVVCGDYISPSGNVIYTSSGIYTDVIQNAAGCDSIITVYLTVNFPSVGTDIQTACSSYTWIDGNTYTVANNVATYTLMNATGCDSVVTLDLTIHTVDVSVIITGPTISANAALASYQWLDCANNLPITGETNQSYTVTMNGVFAVEVTQNGCADTSDCVAIVTLGLEENTFDSEVNVYPIPTDGEVTIDLGASYSNVEISLFNESGKLLEYRRTAQIQLLQLSIREPSGVYFLRIVTEDSATVIRIIKK